MKCKNTGWISAISKLPDDLSDVLKVHTDTLSKICYEIILRSRCPLALETSAGRYYLTDNGCLIKDPHSQKMRIISSEDIKNTFLKLCSYSVYSYQHQINGGYITVGGGCRAGISGSAVLAEGKITTVKHITSIHIRIARECIGCAEELLSSIDPLKGVLICGAPSTGKTTLLRDAARLLSHRYNVSLIDERNELSASADGVSYNDIGMCDVYINYPKKTAILQAIRGMSPDIIVCDELGDPKEVEALRYALFCGVSFIATVHSEASDRAFVQELLDTGAFSYLVTLSDRHHAGRIKEIQCLN